MPKNAHMNWDSRLDSFCVVVGAMVPTGIVIGNVGFESMIGLVGISWIIRSIIAKENPLPRLLKHPLILPWLLWFGSIIVSLIWNGPGSKGWAHDVVLIRYVIFFAAMLDVSQRRSVASTLIIGLAAGVIWGLLNTLLAYTIGNDVFGNELIRYSYKLKEASRIASVAAYAMPFFIGLSIQNPRLSGKMKVGAALIGIISLVQIIHVNIRTVEIAAVMGILSFIVFLMIKNGRTKVLGVTAVLFGILIWMFIKFAPSLELSSLYDRLNIWKVAWAMWLDHPIVGVSASAWQDYYKEIVNSGVIDPYTAANGKVIWSKEASHSHSLFLQLLSCTGILGLLSFCWLLVRTFKLFLLKPASRWFNGLITWPTVFIVIGLTGWNIFGSQYQTIFAYFLLLTAVSQNQKEI